TAVHRADLDLVQHDDVGQVQKAAIEGDDRREIEDGPCAGRAPGLEESRHRRNRYFQLTDQDAARVERGGVDVARLHGAVRARRDDDRVFRVGNRYDRGAGLQIGRYADIRQIDSLTRQKRVQFTPEEIVADPADQRHAGAQSGRGDRLVGTLAARRKHDAFAEHGLARPGKTRRHSRDIHDDAAGN